MAHNRTLSAFISAQPLTVLGSQSRSVNNAPRCAMHERKTTAGKKRARQRVQHIPENGKIISEVSIGDEFIGTISEVGPASSSWVDIGVFTKGGRPVHARLPFPVRKGRTSHNDVKGALVPVYVKRINQLAGRIEVRKGVKPQDEDELPSAVKMLDTLSVGDKLQGTVIGLGPYGAVVDANIYRIGKRTKITPCHGLLQRKSFRKEWYSAADTVIRKEAETLVSIGDVVDVYVRAAHVQNAFLLLDAHEVREEDVAEGRRRFRAATRKRHRRAPIDSLHIGEIREGIVTNVARYGLFVDVGVKSNGLLHYSEMGERHKLDWKEAIGVNAHLTVEVLRVEHDKISLRLISLREEALRDAFEKADSATARTEDVELVAALQTSSRRGYPGKIVGDSKEKTHGSTNEVMVSKIEARDEADEDFEYGSKDEENPEEQGKFSDEYFEDKYGF